MAVEISCEKCRVVLRSLQLPSHIEHQQAEIRIRKMNRPIALLASLFFLIGADRASADVPKATIARLQSEIAKAKQKLKQLRKSRKLVHESHKKYRSWIKLRIKRLKSANAQQLAKLREALILRRQLAAAGTGLSASLIFDRNGRVVGASATVSISSTERAVGALLGKRLTDKAFDEYAAWRRSIGNDVPKALKKAKQYQDAERRLSRSIREIERWIRAATTPAKQLAALEEIELLSKVKVNGKGDMALWLEKNDVTDDMLARVASLKGIQSLSLRNNRKITSNGIRQLSKMTSLRKLILKSTNLTDDGLLALTALKLKRLELSGCSGITDRGMAHIARIKTLRELMIGNTNITDAGLATLTQLNLTQLEFADCPKITDAGMVHVGQMKAMRVMQIFGTPITDKGLAHLHSLKDLEFLCISLRNRGIKATPQGLAKLKKALPGCRIVRKP